MDKIYELIFKAIEDMGGRCQVRELDDKLELSYAGLRKKIIDLERREVLKGVMKGNKKFVEITHPITYCVECKPKLNLAELLKGVELEEM